jgi:AcrR family transcriptional regulator
MDRIIAAAEREFGQKGLAGAKVTDIARAAGVSKQLIYHYFSNKDTLYSEMMVTISQDHYEVLLKIDYDNLSPETAISRYFTTVFDIYLQDICSATVTLEQGLHAGAQVRFDRKANLLRKELLRRMASALKRGQAAGIFHPGLTIEQVHFMSIVVVAGCISFRDMYVRYAGVELPAATNDDTWRQFAVDFFMRGIAP